MKRIQVPLGPPQIPQSSAVIPEFDSRCGPHIYIYIYTYIYVCVCVCVFMYEGESNENLKSAIKIKYKYLRFSFDSPSYVSYCIPIL